MMIDKVRVDKWLWSVRIFKSRTISGNAVKGGKVKVNDKLVKSSFQLQRGDKVIVSKNGFNFHYEVVDLIEKRVGAPLAQVCYTDQTPEEELNKYKNWFIGKSGAERRERGTGRPTKRERREIEDYKISQYLEWEDDEQ